MFVFTEITIIRKPQTWTFFYLLQGAYKRHQAILNGEVLNIPNSETLDGLFSAGLRFLHARQYDTGRLSLARYEMLHL